MFLIVGKHFEAELGIAERDLRLQLLDRRDLPVLAQVDGLRISQRLVVVTNLALVLGHQLLAFLGMAGRRRVQRREHESRGEQHRARIHYSILAPLLIAGSAAAADIAPSARELAELSLEQLASLQITSVSKRLEPLADAAASVFIISAEDIRRSGATTLPEALRLAPNLHVAQASASAYTIAARGVYNTSANKMLVLIDGRSVYSPLFSGVFWDVQEVMLESVERIEVISGPGGTLWGVNAVNGVINVITRSANDTVGGLVATHAGNRDASGAARYGARLGDHGYFRVYGKYFDRDHSTTAAGAFVDDAWHRAQAGLRVDWSRGSEQLSFNANAYRGTIGQPLPGSISISGVDLALAPIPVSGANATARWSHRLAGGSEVMIQAYLDRTERTVTPTFAEKLDIADIQFQHSVQLDAHALVWGAEYRQGKDRVTNSAIFAFLPANVDQRWTSLFAQGDVRLSERLRLTLGARLERNDYTGTEFLPSARLGWKVAADQFAWTAASRAVRAPSRLDRDAFVPGTPPFLLNGGPSVESEVAEVYEVGYRGRLGKSASSSLTVYRAHYDRLHTQEIAPSGTFLVFANGMKAVSTGLEAWSTWHVAPSWRLAAGLTLERQRFELKPGSNDAAAVGTARRDPAHTWLIRSSTDLPGRVELDVTARAVAALENPAVPAYSTVDLRIGWKPRRDLELSLAAWNLADGGHGEFTPVATRAEIRRSIVASVRWQFDSP
jgi:iron complex outermembrane recepter protein